MSFTDLLSLFLPLYMVSKIFEISARHKLDGWKNERETLELNYSVIFLFHNPQHSQTQNFGPEGLPEKQHEFRATGSLKPLSFNQGLIIIFWASPN